MAELIELRSMGFDPSIIDHITEIVDIPEESSTEKTHHTPSQAYIRERRAMAATPADVKEYPNAYMFIIDVPGLMADQLKVQVDHYTLVVSGERKKEKEKDASVKYIRMERRLGKYLKKFTLPENADTDKISAVCQDGLLTVTVEKKPTPEHKQPKTIQVNVASE